MKITRYVGVFERHGDRFLVEKIVLPESSLDDLKVIFVPADDDPLMYDYYDVDEIAAAKLHRKFGIDINLNKFDYAVGAESSTAED